MRKTCCAASLSGPRAQSDAPRSGLCGWRCGATLSLEHGGVEDLRRHDVRVHVGGRPPVLKVTTAVGLRGAGDPHRSATVRNAVAELVDRRRLVRAGEPPFVALAVGLDVVRVLLPELLDGGDDI